jgi:hypothetical protein
MTRGRQEEARITREVPYDRGLAAQADIHLAISFWTGRGS